MMALFAARLRTLSHVNAVAAARAAGLLQFDKMFSGAGIDGAEEQLDNFDSYTSIRHFIYWSIATLWGCSILWNASRGFGPAPLRFLQHSEAKA